MLSPNEGIHRSLKNGLLLLAGCLLVGLGLGLSFWPLFGRLVGLLRGLLVGLLGGLAFGLGLGLVFGLGLGLEAAFQHYTLCFWLARSGVFPWRAIPFLEDATARILLRRVGGGYSFVHRLLLDYFADAYAGASSASSAAQSAQLSSS